jgi:hypothetical protein
MAAKASHRYCDLHWRHAGGSSRVGELAINRISPGCQVPSAEVPVALSGRSSLNCLIQLLGEPQFELQPRPNCVDEYPDDQQRNGAGEHLQGMHPLTVAFHLRFDTHKL